MPASPRKVSGSAPIFTPEPRDLAQAARHHAGPGVQPQLEAVADADRDRDHVLERAADLDPDHVGARVAAEPRRRRSIPGRRWRRPPRGRRCVTAVGRPSAISRAKEGPERKVSRGWCSASSTCSSTWSMRIQLPSSMPFTVETRIAPRGMSGAARRHHVAHAVARDRADHQLAVGERLAAGRRSRARARESRRGRGTWDCGARG